MGSSTHLGIIRRENGCLDGFSTLVLVWAAFAVSPVKAADKANAFHTHNRCETPPTPAAANPEPACEVRFASKNK